VNEIFPIASGAAVGIGLALIAPRLRLPVAFGASLVLGLLATVISGEYKIAWEFLLVDIPLVAASAWVGYLVARYFRLTSQARRQD
jgi:hypothetical protein